MLHSCQYFLERSSAKPYELLPVADFNVKECVSVGGVHNPLRTESFSKKIHRVRLNGPFGAGSQFYTLFAEEGADKV